MKTNLFVLLSTLFFLSTQPLQVFAAASSSSEVLSPGLIKNSPELTEFQNKLLRECVSYIEQTMLTCNLNIEKANNALLPFCKIFSENHLIITLRRNFEMPESLPRIPFASFFENQIKDCLDEMLLGLAREQEHMIQRQQIELYQELNAAARYHRHHYNRMQKGQASERAQKKLKKIERNLTQLKKKGADNELFLAELYKNFPQLTGAAQSQEISSHSSRNPQRSIKSHCYAYAKKKFPSYKIIEQELLKGIDFVVASYNIPASKKCKIDLCKTALYPQIDILLMELIDKKCSTLIQTRDTYQTDLDVRKQKNEEYTAHFNKIDKKLQILNESLSTLQKRIHDRTLHP